MTHLKPLHDNLLVQPMKKGEAIILVPEDSSPTIIYGTVVAVGPFVGSPIFYEEDGEPEFGNSLRTKQDINKKMKANSVHIGDIVYFPYAAAFKLGTIKDPIYAVREQELIAVEKLEDMAN